MLGVTGGLAVAVLVEPGADAAGAVGALRAAGIEDPAVLALDAPGAWAAARNAALDGAAAAEVLAFVDHDVLVAPGWGEALRAAFAGPGGERVGAAGGPLTAGGAPEWLVGDHAEVLGLHADPAAPGPFPGGNVAFRVAALRGVGGFFPARGHVAARDTVGEDRRAQRDLEAAGWRVVTAPEMRAVRDLSALRPAELLRRRVHAGARTAALGRPGRTAGAVLAARAGAAAAARSLRGDRAGALDRAAWAAHGAGALLGAPLAHAGLQPDRAATTLRADVAPAAPHPLAGALAPVLRRARRSAGGDVRGAILLYHRVVEGEDPLGLAVSPEHFAQQLTVLAQRWTPAGLDAVVDGDAGPHGVAITFDDGYHDNLVAAAPALRAAGIPATLFASTGHVASGAGFWWDEVRALVEDEPGDGVLSLDLAEGERAWAPGDAAQRATVRAHVHAALRTRDRATIARALAELRVWAGRSPGPGAPPERDRPMTVAELQQLAGARIVDVQAHGRTHLSLAHAPASVRGDELSGSADDLEAWLGARPTVFSYPFGVLGVDVDAATRAAARAAGYRRATVNSPGLVRSGTDPLALPRLAVPDVDGAAFARWLHAALPGRRA
jgi:peptidoglycan/xylan/chitin deacetylase (PgdA/CDA1 family)